MRVGVGKWAGQTFAAKDDDETMTFAGFDDDFDVANLFDLLLQHLDLFLADACVNATSAPVGHDAVRVE